jgi:hypothetical protein
MKTKAQYRTAMILCALAALMACGTAQASTIGTLGQGDPLTLTFDENGNATIDLRNGTGPHPDPGFAAVDPNTGVHALTYLLHPGLTIGPGIGYIVDPSGQITDAISFYNIGSQGYMAYYSTLPGTDLADTISGGFIPSGVLIATENANGTFAYFSGGSPGVNSDYYGTSSPSVPDGGSTLTMLGSAFALVSAFSLKLRK